MVVVCDGLSVCPPLDTSESFHYIDPLIAGGAEVFHVAGPGEARSIQSQSEEGVDPGVGHCFSCYGDDWGVGQVFLCEAHDCAFVGVDRQAPGVDPVLECCGSFLQVGLCFWQCCSSADDCYVISIYEEVGVGWDVEVRHEYVEEEGT